MKRILHLVLIALLLISCKKEKEEREYERLMIGKWRTTASTMAILTSDDEIVQELDNMPYVGADTWEFEKDSVTFRSPNGSGRYRWVVSTSGDKKVVNITHKGEQPYGYGTLIIKSLDNAKIVFETKGVIMPTLENPKTTKYKTTTTISK